MERIQKNFGFGCMRLKLTGGEVDTALLSRIVDRLMERGFNYFDTAHGYLGGKSETALRECLTRRYPRERYVLTDKLTDGFFQTQADIRPLFRQQLEACGVEYFDFYLMHAQNAENFQKFKRCRAYETALELMSEGKFRHFGISFHDKAAVLEQILTEYPQIEVVQLQLNYIDWEDPAVESRKCWEVCRRLGKKVIVMEPCRGGNLASLPQDARAVLDGLGGGSPASYAIRFAAGHEGVVMVLSGMTSLEQVEDNLSFMERFRPLDRRELQAVEQVRDILRSKRTVPCTACGYCTGGCPMHIAIPDLFACLNNQKIYPDWNSEFYYGVYTAHNGKASSCIRCGACEAACPQRLPIRALLETAARTFEKNG